MAFCFCMSPVWHDLVQAKLFQIWGPSFWLTNPLAVTSPQPSLTVNQHTKQHVSMFWFWLVSPPQFPGMLLTLSLLPWALSVPVKSHLLLCLPSFLQPPPPPPFHLPLNSFISCTHTHFPTHLQIYSQKLASPYGREDASCLSESGLTYGIIFSSSIHIFNFA